MQHATAVPGRQRVMAQVGAARTMPMGPVMTELVRPDVKDDSAQRLVRARRSADVGEAAHCARTHLSGAPTISSGFAQNWPRGNQIHRVASTTHHANRGDASRCRFSRGAEARCATGRSLARDASVQRLPCSLGRRYDRELASWRTGVLVIGRGSLIANPSPPHHFSARRFSARRLEWRGSSVGRAYD